MKKKILFLGATGAMYDVINIAKKKGIYTIVVDYYPNSPAKKIADKAYLASTTDFEQVLQIAVENQIDGIFTGFSDANLLPARRIADALNLPFYASENQIKITTDKLLFKKTCRSYGIPVVPEYNLNDEASEADLAKVQYPVIVKPADAWASKGVSICYNQTELHEGINQALVFSKTRRVIVERYMAEYPDVCMYFNIQNGELSLAAMCERDMNMVEEKKAMQPNMLFFPCRFIPLYYEQLETKLSCMLEGLNIKDGTMFIQCFVVDGVLTPFEMGYRLCGASEYILCSAENGINSCEMLLDYALTGRFEGWDAKKENHPVFSHSDCILLTLMRPGKIYRIEGLEEIKAMPQVLNVLQFYYEGDEISNTSMGTLNQTFARFFLQAKNKEELLNIIDHVQKKLKILDENGKEMLLPGYDCETAHLLCS